MAKTRHQKKQEVHDEEAGTTSTNTEEEAPVVKEYATRTRTQKANAKKANAEPANAEPVSPAGQDTPQDPPQSHIAKGKAGPNFHGAAPRRSKRKPHASGPGPDEPPATEITIAGDASVSQAVAESASRTGGSKVHGAAHKSKRKPLDSAPGPDRAAATEIAIDRDASVSHAIAESASHKGGREDSRDNKQVNVFFIRSMRSTNKFH